MAAHVTTGKSWPDGSPCIQGSVLYLKGEGTDRSIQLRMQAAGADPNYYYVSGRKDDDDAPMIDLALDISGIQHAIDSIPNLRMIIVDTLDSMYPSMRMIDNANIRKCLFPLQEIAEKRNLAVVVFAHTNKGG